MALPPVGRSSRASAAPGGRRRGGGASARRRRAERGRRRCRWPRATAKSSGSTRPPTPPRGSASSPPCSGPANACRTTTPGLEVDIDDRPPSRGRRRPCPKSPLTLARRRAAARLPLVQADQRLEDARLGRGAAEAPAAAAGDHRRQLQRRGPRAGRQLQQPPRRRCEADRPLLLLTTATADRVDRPADAPPPDLATRRGPPVSLTTSTRGGPSASASPTGRWPTAVTRFLWSQDDLRPDGDPVHMVQWDDDSYSHDLIDGFMRGRCRSRGRPCAVGLGHRRASARPAVGSFLPAGNVGLPARGADAGRRFQRRLVRRANRYEAKVVATCSADRGTGQRGRCWSSPGRRSRRAASSATWRAPPRTGRAASSSPPATPSSSTPSTATARSPGRSRTCRSRSSSSATATPSTPTPASAADDRGRRPTAGGDVGATGTEDVLLVRRHRRGAGRRRSGRDGRPAADAAELAARPRATCARSRRPARLRPGGRAAVRPGRQPPRRHRRARRLPAAGLRGRPRPAARRRSRSGPGAASRRRAPWQLAAPRRAADGLLRRSRGRKRGAAMS